MSLEPQEKTEEADEAKATYFGKADGSNLNATLYGQTAMTLDTSGSLTNLGKKTARIDTILAISDAET